jgi:PAS domain S-box-containing protein
MTINEFLDDLPLLTPQQRQQLQAAFQVALVESPLPTVLTDLDGRILGTNSLVEELLGADETELHGRLVTELVAEEDRHLTAAVIHRLATGRTRRESYETRWVRPDGGLLWLHRHVLRVDGPDGDAQPYLVALLEDVTRARLAEREAARLTEISKRIAAGASIADIAARLAELAEQRWSRVGCMLNIADEAAGVVRPVPHSRLPAGFVDAFAEIPISTVGIPCGIAAAAGRPVAIANLLTDPRTVNMRPLLKRYNMVSGWSLALHDVEGQLLGTIGLFHPYRREPDDADWEALSGYADVAAIAMMVDRGRARSGDLRPSGAAQACVAEPGISGGDVGSVTPALHATLTLGDGSRSFVVTIAPVSAAQDDANADAGEGVGAMDPPAWTGPLGSEQLSAREREIVNRLLNGDRVPAIARALYLGQSTVRNHLTSVYRKLNVSSQQDLIDLYKRRSRLP